MYRKEEISVFKEYYFQFMKMFIAFLIFWAILIVYIFAFEWGDQTTVGQKVTFP